ncbi:MAG TPA: GFA family protein [Chitinolyticbacter sp.]|nr:GFA family protein [Chitinolyticbacter sp.]
MKYRGSCHCGRLAFEAEGELTGVVSCNCSICQRKGALMWFLPRAALTLLTPDEDIASYTFHRHVISHRFCPVCGMHPYGEGVDPHGNAMAAINVRCLEDVDLNALPVTQYDGRSLP